MSGAATLSPSPRTRPVSSEPWRVTVKGGRVKVYVMDGKHDQVPTAFALAATDVDDKAALRILGGCSNMTIGKEALIKYFEDALGGRYRGLLFSGGTREATEAGEISIMITDVPAYLAASNPGSKALGTTPRTGTMSLVGDSRFEITEGTGINPGQDAVLIVQDGPEKASEWDGDVSTYFELMQNLKLHAAFRAVGAVSFNGGGVTWKEIMRFAKSGLPTILIRGSGRKTDEFITKYEAGDAELLKELPDNRQIAVVDLDDPSTLTAALEKYTFLV